VWAKRYNVSTNINKLYPVISTHFKVTPVYSFASNVKEITKEIWVSNIKEIVKEGGGLNKRLPYSRAFAAKTTGQLYILGLNSHTFSMNRSKIGVYTQKMEKKRWGHYFAAAVKESYLRKVKQDKLPKLLAKHQWQTTGIVDPSWNLELFHVPSATKREREK
jgi:hypothetical protein